MTKKPLKRHIIHHKDGSVWAKGSMSGSTMAGYWEWFRKDGSKMRSGYFKDGKQTGTWTTFDKKGKVVKETMINENDFGVKLPQPAFRALKNAKITSLTQLSKHTEEEIRELHGMGPSSLPKLRTALHAKGLSFKK